MPVTLHVWRVPARRVGSAFLHMARRRVPPGVTFAKFLGTSRGFRPTEADLTRYAAVTVSAEPVTFSEWDRLAEERARVELNPLHSRGTWSGLEPFKTGDREESRGMILALTRARLRPSRALTFWRAIPPVVRELDAAPGLLAYFGMGEAPIGWQGTVSVWSDAADLARFAYRQPEHRAVIARTPAARWYAEELFARFAVREISGDRSVLGWLPEDVGAEDGTGR
ncbi:monooxygenase [Actinoplanes sp. NPDC049596]|uniref:monooxygenase n=1 Tax=unclassified Actinoplanes TaxID=2626549 RepID=UPI00343CB859